MLLAWARAREDDRFSRMSIAPATAGDVGHIASQMTRGATARTDLALRQLGRTIYNAANAIIKARR